MASVIILKSPSQLKIMEEANQIVSQTLSMLTKHIAPGVSTFELDSMAEKYARDHDSEPAFKGYRGFPGSLCVSLNDQVVQVQFEQKNDKLSINFNPIELHREDVVDIVVK